MTNALPGSIARSTNLPLPISSFIGREREIAEAERLLGTTRLLTLTGAGGVGKTRLALRVAETLDERYPDGVWLVELASLADPTLVPEAIANVLGLREEAGKTSLERLSGYLAQRNLLLLLDNCEHLIADCAQVVESLLRACRNLTVLATSREALGIEGETALRVPSLATPDPGKLAPGEDVRAYDAVRLFVERGRAVTGEFELAPADEQAVAEICHRLDGIPLAIELAAARLRMLSVDQIVTRLNDRFRLLTGGRRTTVPRQQTLRALIDWSFDLLEERERTLLCRLSVFAGGFSLEAVEAVCAGEPVQAAAIFDLLAQLIDKSLVQADKSGREERYRLLETVRQYARERLLERGEAEQVRDQHLRYFLEWAEAVEEAVERGNRAEWYKRLETDLDNLRLALEWSFATGKAESGARLAGSLQDFWFDQGYWGEGRRYLEESLTVSDQISSPQRAKVLVGLCMVRWGEQDFAWAKERLEESLAISRGASDAVGQGRALVALSVAHQWLGDLGQAISLAEQAMEIFRATDRKRSTVGTLFQLAGMLASRSDFAEASLLFEQSLELSTRVGDKRDMSVATNGIATIARHQGDYRRAAEYGFKALALAAEADAPVQVVMFLAGLAFAASRMGQRERAARLYAASASRDEKIGGALVIYRRGYAEHEQELATLRQELGEPALTAAWAEGQSMTLDEAIAEAAQVLVAPPELASEFVAMPGHATGQTGGYPAGLSEREVEVLRLVAQGLTSAQVAGQLVISPVTVNTHLRSIYSKLGVNSRSAATRFAVEHGLV